MSHAATVILVLAVRLIVAVTFTWFVALLGGWKAVVVALTGMAMIDGMFCDRLSSTK